MLETFAVSFRLKAAYKTNSIIWALKSLPLIKRLLPASLYASRGLKMFANIISGMNEFFSVFFWKIIYLLPVFLIASEMDSPASAFSHMMIVLTVIGGFMNTNVFDPTKDKFYAMFIMRLDAKRYTLSGYFYFLSKSFLGFMLTAPVFAKLCHAPLLLGFLIPFYVVSVKLCFTAVFLARCKKRGDAVNENSPALLRWGSVLILCAAAVVPPCFGVMLGVPVFYALCAVMIVPAVLAARYICRFDKYRQIYKRLLGPDSVVFAQRTAGAGATQQKAMQKQISDEPVGTSNKTGYKYFNELFMKRHSKLMTRMAKRITAIALVALIASVAIVLIFKGAAKPVNNLLMTCMPYFLFLMYLINCGRSITQAMFMNCDHSMLTYRFYRQPKAILLLFIERLKYVALINLMPASVIAVGLPLLLLASGGTKQPLNYLVLFVSIIAMSLFFSVHNMVLYYLLQPYNVNLEMKSAAYGIINWITYFVCYMAIQFELPTLAFCSVISAFCIIYAGAAVALAYRLAPKTFKLR